MDVADPRCAHRDGDEACRGRRWPDGNVCLAHRAERDEILAGRYGAGQPFTLELSGARVDPAACTAITRLTGAHPATPVDYRFHAATFSGPADFAGATFSGNADFAGATFTDGADFDRATFNEDAGFYLATFSGNAGFGETAFNGIAGFGGAAFNGGAGFGGAAFTGRGGFDGAAFSADAFFGGAAFRADAGFAEATFSGDAGFGGAAFSAGAGFYEATFTAAADFAGATFSGDPGFYRATFSGAADFAGATFSGNAFFAGATFTGPVSFAGATAAGRIDLTDLRHARPGTLHLGPLRLALTRSSLTEPLTLTAAEETAGLVALSDCVLTAPVVVDAPVRLTATRFARTAGLDHLRVVGDPHWPTRRHRLGRRRVVADELADDDERPGDDQLEVLYRQLRAGLEASKSHAGANDFYWGELDARRRHAPRRSFEHWLLGAYRVIFGYGVRASRPFAWWLAAVAVLTFVFTTRTGQLLSADSPITITYWGEAFAFVLQNSTNVLRAVDVGLQADGTLLVLAGRLATITLLAGVFLALRSRVTR